MKFFPPRLKFLFQVLFYAIKTSKIFVNILTAVDVNTKSLSAKSYGGEVNVRR